MIADVVNEYLVAIQKYLRHCYRRCPKTHSKIIVFFRLSANLIPELKSPFKAETGLSRIQKVNPLQLCWQCFPLSQYSQNKYRHSPWHWELIHCIPFRGLETSLTCPTNQSCLSKQSEHISLLILPGLNESLHSVLLTAVGSATFSTYRYLQLRDAI